MQCVFVILMDQASPKRSESHRGKELHAQKKRRLLHSGKKCHIFSFTHRQSHSGLKFTLTRNEVTIETKKVSSSRMRGGNIGALY